MSSNHVARHTSLQPALDCLISADSSFGDPLDHYVGHSDLSIVEIWSYSEADWPELIYGDISLENVKEWVDKEGPVKAGRKPIASLKMIIGTRGAPSDDPASTKELKQSMLRLSEKLRFQTSCLAADGMLFTRFLSYEGLGLSPEASAVNSYQASFREWSIAWSFDPKTSSSRAMLTLSRATGDPDPGQLLECLNKSRNLLDQALFLPYVMAVYSVTKLSAIVHQSGLRGSSLESDIVYYLENQDDPLGYPDLISKFDGDAYSAGVMASCQENLEVVRQVVKHFLGKEGDSSSNLNNTTQIFSLRKAEFLKACLRNLDQRAAARITEAAKCQRRSARQVSTIMGIRAQRDQDISLEIARSSRQIATESRRDQAVSLDIARASRAIALQSRKDSSSMKTIAAVTMSFLPGTFVASFFAMPLFQWDSDNGRVVNPQIWIFWTVTIPLTIFTFVVWWVWLRYQSKRDTASQLGVLEGITAGEAGNDKPEASRQNWTP
jgi:hypothetical protein